MVSKSGNIEYGITRSYAKTRKWGAWESVREIIQNALDENERATGQAKYTQVIDNKGLHIIDEGQGIAIHNLLVGESEKSCWARGRFGEGLKVAFIVLLDLGYRIEIISGDIIIRPQFIRKTVGEKEVEILNVSWKPNTRKAGGTQVSILGFYENFQDKFVLSDRTKNSVKLLGGKELVKECKVDISNCIEQDEAFSGFIQIIKEPPGIEPCIYVRDIYVDDISNIMGKHALYSYNLVNVGLDESRRIPKSHGVQKEVGKVVSFMDDADFWVKVFTDKTLFESQVEFDTYGFVGSLVRTFPTDAADDKDTTWYKKRQKIKAAVMSAIHTTFGANPCWAKPSQANIARYYGYEPIKLDDYDLENFVEKLLYGEFKHLDEIVRESSTTDTLPDKRLTPIERMELKGLRVLALSASKWSSPKVVAMPAGGGSYGKANLVTNEIWISRDLLTPNKRESAIGTLIHEIAHLELGSDDNTVDMINSVDKIGAYMTYQILHDSSIRSKARRAFGITTTTWKGTSREQAEMKSPKKTLEFYGEVLAYGSKVNTALHYGVGFYCVNCGRHTHVYDPKPGQVYYCKDCGSQMIHAERAGEKCPRCGGKGWIWLGRHQVDCPKCSETPYKQTPTCKMEGGSRLPPKRF